MWNYFKARIGHLSVPHVITYLVFADYSVVKYNSYSRHQFFLHNTTMIRGRKKFCQYKNSHGQGVLVRNHDDVIKWNIFRVTALCEGNSPATGEFPSQRPVTRSFDVLFDMRWINGWVNNRVAGDLRRNHADYDVTEMPAEVLGTMSWSNLTNLNLFYSIHYITIFPIPLWVSEAVIKAIESPSNPFHGLDVLQDNQPSDIYVIELMKLTDIMGLKWGRSNQYGSPGTTLCYVINSWINFLTFDFSTHFRTHFSPDWLQSW